MTTAQETKHVEVVQFFVALPDGEESVTVDAAQKLGNGEWGRFPKKFYADQKRMGVHFDRARALIGIPKGKELKFVYLESPTDKGSRRRLLWVGRSTDEPPADMVAAQGGLPASHPHAGVPQNQGSPFAEEERKPAPIPRGPLYEDPKAQPPLSREDGMRWGAAGHDAAALLAAWVQKHGRAPSQEEADALLAAFQSMQHAIYGMTPPQHYTGPALGR